MQKLNRAVVILVVMSLLTMAAPTPLHAADRDCYGELLTDLRLCEEMFPLWWQSAARGACYAVAYGLFDSCVRSME